MISFQHLTADLAARKQTAARVTYAKTVAACAAGKPLTDAELTEAADALVVLNVPAVTVDADAALYQQYPAMKAAVDTLPTDEQRAANKAKLIEELAAAEGKVTVATRMHQHSAQMLNDLQALRVRVQNFGREDDRLRHRLQDATERLAPVFAGVGPPPELKPEPAAVPPPAPPADAPDPGAGKSPRKQKASASA